MAFTEGGRARSRRVSRVDCVETRCRALALRPLPLVDVASPQTQAVKQEAACVAADCQGWCSEHFRESHCSNCKCQCPFCESGRI